MSSNRRKLKEGARKKLLRRFMKIMLSTFFIGTIIVLAGIAGYQKISGDETVFDKIPKLTAEEKEEEKKEKLKTNVAIFGVDIDGYRADTMFVAHFDGETNSAELISIPRDTMIRFTDSEHERIRKVNRNTPRTIKLNEMTAYSGIKKINDFTVPEIEKILGIEIDNYVTVEIEAFRNIVDIVGGVEVDVPQRMYYNDYAQDLHIDLQPGLQLLDGENAEGLVRYRKGYASGDIGRIGTQQIFLKAFAKTVLSPSNITKLPKIVPEIFKHVTTDINILDVPKYYGYAKNFDAEFIGFHTIPGEPLYDNNLWYFVPDMNEMDEFVDKVIYKKTDKVEMVEDIKKDKTVTIEILNGGAPAGTAASLKRTIEDEGYDVGNIGNYTGAYKEETVIYAKDISKARQFKKFCGTCEVRQDNLLDDSIDVRIIIGSNGI